MREILKDPEPPSLLAHRKATHSNYDNYKDKDLLRKALVAEQRGICCYCTCRIYAAIGAMKIEHWLCQEHHENEQLNYANLLGACLGGEKQRPRLQHCDTKKGYSALKWNPLESTHHIGSRIGYTADGKIISDDPEFDVQLNDILNLNLPFMYNNRKASLDAVLDWWKSKKAELHDAIPRTQIENKQKQYVERSPLEPFSQVAVWWLQQKLDKRNK